SRSWRPPQQGGVESDGDQLIDALRRGGRDGPAIRAGAVDVVAGGHRGVGGRQNLQHLGDVPPVGARVPAHVDNEVDRHADYAVDVRGVQGEPALSAQQQQAGEDLLGGVGVDGTQGAYLARVHRLQHRPGLVGAYLANDDPYRVHPERVLDRRVEGDLAVA